MRYRMVLAGILLVSATVVVAAEPESPASPQPPAASTYTATQPAEGDAAKVAAPAETGESKDQPAEGGAEPDCD
jgi:hypothetical protein